MTRLLLDTHAWAWSLSDDPRLTAGARHAMADADAILVSPVSFFEIAQEVRLGRWPEMLPLIDRLPVLLDEQGGTVAPFDPPVCLAAGMMDWTHRDPFDRLLAATARHHGLVLVSADTVFDGIAARVW